MTDPEIEFWETLFTRSPPPRPRTRLDKKREARALRTARKTLRVLAGLARRRQITRESWLMIKISVMGWELRKPARVPRVLQAELGETIGGPTVPSWNLPGNAAFWAQGAYMLGAR